MKDYLNDLLTRIRNGQRAGLDIIQLHPNMPRICYDVLNILYKGIFMVFLKIQGL